MNHEKTQRPLLAGLVVACSLGLAACSDSDDDPVASPAADAEFDIQIVNLTNAQPLSPPALILHTEGYHAFVDGSAASVGLEMLAEGGDNDQLITEARAASQYIGHVDAPAPIGPRSQSNTYSLSFPASELPDVELSIVSMLVHTNDGFSAIDGYALGNLPVGGSVTLNAPVWDSGTEANTEATDTIPGPAFQGEGFSATQDDAVDVVRFHQGIVGNTQTEDGLSTSVLGEQHRFDNPAMRVLITRTN